MDDVLDAVEDERAGAADIQEVPSPGEILAARLEQHRQPDPERRPVELFAEGEREGANVVRGV